MDCLSLIGVNEGAMASNKPALISVTAGDDQSTAIAIPQSVEI